MPFVGLPYYGFCKVTVTQAADGSESEALGEGVLTRSIVRFADAPSTESEELWAGDRREQQDTGSPEASLTLERSWLSLEEEAALGGHSYSKDDGLTVKEDDTPPYFRVARLAKFSREDRSKGYRLTGFYRVQFAPVGSDISTRQKKPSYTTQSLTGTATANAEGLFKTSNDFDTYDAALSAFKTFLNVT